MSDLVYVLKLWISVCADKEDDCFNDNRDFWVTDSLVDLSIFGDDTLVERGGEVPSNCTILYSNGTVLFNGTLLKGKDRQR